MNSIYLRHTIAFRFDGAMASVLSAAISHVYIPVSARGGVGGVPKFGIQHEEQIFGVESESQVKIDQFGRKGQKQRSFGQKSKFDTRI